MTPISPSPPSPPHPVVELFQAGDVLGIHTQKGHRGFMPTTATFQRLSADDPSKLIVKALSEKRERVVDRNDVYLFSGEGVALETIDFL